MLAKYETRNNEALERLLKSGVKLRSYSPKILAAAEKASFDLYNEYSNKDADFKRIFEQWKPFRNRIYKWNAINEGSFSRYGYEKPMK